MKEPLCESKNLDDPLDTDGEEAMPAGFEKSLDIPSANNDS